MNQPHEADGLGEVRGFEPMSMRRIILRSLLFGILAEGVAMAVSLGLYAMPYGIDSMEPPFKSTATALQMPGIVLSGKVGWGVEYSAWCQGSIIFIVQALLWGAIAFALLLWRNRRMP